MKPMHGTANRRTSFGQCTIFSLTEKSHISIGEQFDISIPIRQQFATTRRVSGQIQGKLATGHSRVGFAPSERSTAPSPDSSKSSSSKSARHRLELFARRRWTTWRNRIQRSLFDDLQDEARPSRRRKKSTT